jgi:uncharacterized protein (DUF952 family)
MLIFKVVPRGEWDAAGEDYRGSPHDQADGFLHFSTTSQLATTLRLYYAGRDDLVLLAVEGDKLGAALKWEHAPSRGEDFPHLFAALPRSAVLWTKPLKRDASGDFVIPA